MASICFSGKASLEVLTRYKWQSECVIEKTVKQFGLYGSKNPGMIAKLLEKQKEASYDTCDILPSKLLEINVETFSTLLFLFYLPLL